MADRVEKARAIVKELFKGKVDFGDERAFSVLAKYSPLYHAQEVELAQTKTRKQKRKVQFRQNPDGTTELVNPPPGFTPFGGDEWEGAPISAELTWEEIAEHVTGRSAQALSIYEDSWRPIDDLEPEEEFLRNYDCRGKEDSDLTIFAMGRSERESAVFGDLPLRHWFHLLTSLSSDLDIMPLGLQTLATFIDKYGPPIHQDTRDLSQTIPLVQITMLPLFVEACLAEALLELSTFDRLAELHLTTVFIGGVHVDPYSIIREHFLVTLPHPKKVNNSLRSAYSWFVKVFGTSAPSAVVLTSTAGDDCNSKHVVYDGYERVENPVGQAIRRTRFAEQSLNDNRDKIEEAIAYARTLSPGTPSLRTLLSLYHDPMSQSFDPRDAGQVLVLSLLLAVQVMSGYGRAWVMNKSEDPEAFMKPGPDNLVTRVAEITEEMIFNACVEAEASGHSMVPSKDVAASLIKLARNTASGLKTSVKVKKKFGRHAADRSSKGYEKITSGKKSLVVLTRGDEIMKAESLSETYDRPETAQRKGTRDVPIKATREIYAVSINALAPQLVLTLPLNEHLSKSRHTEGSEPGTLGTTAPSSKGIAPKAAVGDLEATGSRVVDAADTFRMTALPHIIAFALDYSNFDKHMTKYIFRDPMRRALLRAAERYPKTREYTYDGVPLTGLVHAGYGPGRAEGTLWDGNRHVIRISREKYDSLPEEVRNPTREQQLFRPPKGVRGVLSLEGVEPDARGDILVCAVDGSDLARVYTHLSGENSTLVMNTLHNMALGKVIQEQLALRAPGTLEVISEMYVGDDTLMYLRPKTLVPSKLDHAIQVIFDTVAKCGHEASPAKTTFCALSTEKTQTHAKQGSYIPQDRMMVISSERKKDIEDMSAYMRSNAAVMSTKVSRGFSHKLAMDILLFKASTLGYRKFKNIVHTREGFKLRDLVQHAGFTTQVVRDPFTLHVPVPWGGFGVYPTAVNLVATEGLVLESLSWARFQELAKLYVKFSSQEVLPHWNEAHPDASELDVVADTSSFHRFTRPAVAHALSTPIVRELVKELPLGRFSPTSLKDTMLRDALLKEPRARTLLAPAYEAKYVKLLSDMRPHQHVTLASRDGALSINLASIFVYEYLPMRERHAWTFPDTHLSTPFQLQKMTFGPRESPRLRHTFVDRIESILRADGIMRGIITANDILHILYKFRGVNEQDVLAYLLSLMNLERSVCERLAIFLLSGNMRFDAVALNRDGVGGDEFTMSLGVCDKKYMEEMIKLPGILTEVERIAIALHVGQIHLARATLGYENARIDVQIPGERLKEFKRARMGALTKRYNAVKGVRDLMTQYVRSDLHQLHVARIDAFP